MEDNHFKVVYSLGLRCRTEGYLGYCGVKRFSSIVGSVNGKSITQLIHAVTSDFKWYTETKRLISTDGKKQQSTNNWGKWGKRTLVRGYDNMEDFGDATIAHHNTDEEYEHFERAVRRWKTIQKHKIRTLFILVMDTRDGHTKEIELQNYIMLSEILKEKFDCRVAILLNIDNTNFFREYEQELKITDLTTSGCERSCRSLDGHVYSANEWSDVIVTNQETDKYQSNELWILEILKMNKIKPRELLNIKEIDKIV